ncbi:MAG: hypothetical protein QE484_10860, partial [Rhizobium sp.]|nr:hypothetical protein [Rhizobium sp.]
VPNVVRYQTALHSVTSGASIDQRFSLHKHGNEKSGEKVEVFVTAGRISLNLLPDDSAARAACTAAQIGTEGGPAAALRGSHLQKNCRAQRAAAVSPHRVSQ